MSQAEAPPLSSLGPGRLARPAYTGAETCHQKLWASAQNQRTTHRAFVQHTERYPFLSTDEACICAQGWTSAPLSDSGPEWMGLCLCQEWVQGWMEKATKVGPGVGLDCATCH